MKKSLIASLVALGLLSQPLISQQQNARLGIVLHGGLDLHMTAFSRIPEAENCCPEFTGGQGRLFGLGAQYLSSLTPTLGLDIRVGYYSAGVDLATTESLPILNKGIPETATVRHDLAVASSMLALDALGRFPLGERLHLLGGVTIGYNLSGTYDQKEVFVTPSNATFAENGLRVRNQRSGSLTSLSGIYGGLTTGLSYEFAVNADNTTFIAPELLITFSPTNLLQETSWLVQRARAGVAISFIPPAVENELSDIELFDIARNSPYRPNADVSSVPVPMVSVSGIDENGNVLSTSAVRIEEFASNRVRPLLPYVFFDKGTHTLAPRYRQISKEQVEDYSLENFYNLDAMVTYYQMLNVVGKRMQQNPDATLKLVGCRDKSEDGLSDELSKRRSLVIKSYLVETWGIDAARISTEDRGMPTNASSSDDADGAAENMRVELSSNDPALLSPVGSRDTLRVFSPAGIRFAPQVQNGDQLKTWTLFVSQNDQIIKAMHGSSVLPSELNWRIAETSRFIPRGTRNLEYMMVVQDSTGKVIPSESGSIPVSEVLLSDKAKTGGTDKSVDRFSLILFGFDRADISPDNQLLINEVKKSITPRSVVKVIGYSDRVGDATYNLGLSEKRAKAVATALATERTSTQGVGETLPLYDNESPEGRFYSRTVEIIVETPR
jgi:outer membrane protein OmpA-like peptidoglycan-associated protein